LEGETAETNLSIPDGGYCQICEVVRPVVYNPETKGAEYKDLTPEDPLTSPDKPTMTPHKKADDEKVSSYKK
jgi:hypothetical protein